MKIYSINTNSYEPVSFEKSYLYNQYDKIQSFLINNYGIKYKEVLKTRENITRLSSGSQDGNAS